jgi:hypothetical protein
MLRLKKEHIGQIVTKGNDKIILSEDMSQRQLLYINNMISTVFIEEYDEVLEKARRQAEDYASSESKRKTNKDVDDIKKLD